MSDTVLVMAAAGTLGSAMVKELVARGMMVRASVRDESKVGRMEALGASCVVADFSDVDSMVQAMDGVSSAVIVHPFGEMLRKYGHNTVAAAKEAGVKRIVRSSGYGAAADAHWRLGREHGAADLAVENSGIPYTILRPNWFMQCFEGVYAQDVRNGEIVLPFGSAAVSWIDVRDIAACAACVLEADGEHDGRTYALTGPEALSGVDIASVFSENIGHGVAFREQEESEFIQSLSSVGVPKWNIDMLVSLSRVVRRNMARNVTGAVEHLTGEKPRTFRKFVEGNAELWS